MLRTGLDRESPFFTLPRLWCFLPGDRTWSGTLGIDGFRDRPSGGAAGLRIGRSPNRFHPRLFSGARSNGRVRTRSYARCSVATNSRLVLRSRFRALDPVALYPVALYPVALGRRTDGREGSSEAQASFRLARAFTRRRSVLVDSLPIGGGAASRPGSRRDEVRDGTRFETGRGSRRDEVRDGTRFETGPLSDPEVRRAQREFGRSSGW